MHRWVLALSLAAGVALCQQPRTGTVERVQVHGKSLEGNLAGDAADRDVSIYLPPSYTNATSKRFPVLYLLHGFTDSDELWMGFKPHWIHFPEVIDRAIARSGTREMIVVMPNAYTRMQGSMYSNSPVTGNWEDFLVQELVPYVDAHYRTLPEAASRGLAGHSMGGYGAARVGMKHPDVFTSIYLLSPWGLVPNFEGTVPMQAQAVKTLADFDKAEFGVRLHLASAAAWSPNPAKPPLFLDLPAQGASVQAKWNANAPLLMLESLIESVRKLKAIACDAGTQDRQIASEVRKLDTALTRNHIAHSFELYDGDHTNRIPARVENKLLPFFNRNLKFGK